MRKQIFKSRILPKNERMILFLLVCDVFSFGFLKNPRPGKKRFEIIWPLVQSLSFQRATLKILTEPGLPISAPLKQRAKVTANNVIPSRAQKCDEAPMPVLPPSRSMYEHHLTVQCCHIIFWESILKGGFIRNNILLPLIIKKWNKNSI